MADKEECYEEIDEKLTAVSMIVGSLLSIIVFAFPQTRAIFESLVQLLVSISEFFIGLALGLLLAGFFIILSYKILKWWYNRKNQKTH